MLFGCLTLRFIDEAHSGGIVQASQVVELPNCDSKVDAH